MAELTIASLNIWGIVSNPLKLKRRCKFIAHYFNNTKVDILNFQEVFTYFHLHQLKDLNKEYPYCIYKRSIVGPKGGLVTFSKYPIANKTYKRYSNKYTPVSISTLEILATKGLLVSEIQDKNITLINTHLSANIKHDWSIKGNQYNHYLSQIKVLHMLINENDKNITISTGDFNIAKESDLYTNLINLNSLYDPFKDDTTPTRHQEFTSKSKKPNCVDYILISGNKNNYQISDKKYILTTKQITIKDKEEYVSDHIGLQMTMKY